MLRTLISRSFSAVAKKPLDGVVVGRVVKVTVHPQAERLKICQVAIGGMWDWKPFFFEELDFDFFSFYACDLDKETDLLQIICGAPNVREDIKVPVATIGTRLTLRMPIEEKTNEVGEKVTEIVDKIVKIKKSKLRGEISQGMICSEAEIGLAEESDGIMILEYEAPVGSDVLSYLDALKNGELNTTSTTVTQ